MTKKSDIYSFTAPWSPSETEDLSWYLERFPRWPGEAFRSRAKRVEENLSTWGRQLFDEAINQPSAKSVWQSINTMASGLPLRLTVQVDHTLPDKSNVEPHQTTRNRLAAAARILTLPWELLHDGRDYLLHGSNRVKIRRSLPVFHQASPQPAMPTLRILVVSPRPEDDISDFFDHRSAAKPLVEALAPLGGVVSFTLLPEPSFDAMMTALRQAKEKGLPFHVLHFDGHGVYLEKTGQGVLCFEESGQGRILFRRKTKLVDGTYLAHQLREFHLPLVFLDACQGGQAISDPTSSIAATLLNHGVGSVVAMSHSVLVSTIQPFVQSFYQALVHGQSVGDALLAGQSQLCLDKNRGYWIGAGNLELHDWFVPVLYQGQDDIVLVDRLPLEASQTFSVPLGELPEPPLHSFIGRSHELLAIERLLLREGYGVLLGEGGEGKTTLACEAARWLACIHRVARVAFVCLENNTHVDAVLEVLGKQIVKSSYEVKIFVNREQAIQAVIGSLREFPTLLVLDNMETVLPPRRGSMAFFDEQELNQLLDLFQQFQEAGETKILFTSREAMPPPFNHHPIDIGPLSSWDGVNLIKNILQQSGITPWEEEKIDNEEFLLELVDSVHGHARTLALLAPELARQSIPKTTADLHSLMKSLEEKYPEDRKRSLYAGVALALNRLSPETRQTIRPLGVFQGGGHLHVIEKVIGIEDTEVLVKAIKELMDTGLCRLSEMDYITFHYALCPFLFGNMNMQEKLESLNRWFEGEAGLVRYLHENLFQNPDVINRTVLLDLPNLYLSINMAYTSLPQKFVLVWASLLATLLKQLGMDGIRKKIVEIRMKASKEFNDSYSAVSFNEEKDIIEELESQGKITEAWQSSLMLLDQRLAAGKDAYEEAPFCIAMSYYLAGMYSSKVGDNNRAIFLLQNARQRLNDVELKENTDAPRLAADAMNLIGNCFLASGQFENAIQCYHTAIAEALHLNFTRNAAVYYVQLGTAYGRQNKFQNALKCYDIALDIVSNACEDMAVAVVWHQKSTLYEKMGEWGLAEESCRTALKIRTKLQDNPGIASCLAQLGNIYDSQKYWDESAKHTKNAAEIFLIINDKLSEGIARNNLAETLLKLNRLDEARAEIHKSILCNKPFGYASTPWNSWYILSKIELADHQIQASDEASQQARNIFFKYRRDGGENNYKWGQLCHETAKAIQEHNIAEFRQTLMLELKKHEISPVGKALIPVLLEILDGNRNPSLIDTHGIEYDNSVEIELLLEELTGK